MAWWQRKIVALLHDPPDKVLDIATHEVRAKVLVQLALQGLPEVPTTGVPPAAWEDDAKKADMVASAADRLNFQKGVTAPSDLLLHPLSGQQKHIQISVNPQQASDAQSEAIRGLSGRTNDPKKRFLLFWRCLEDELTKHEPRVPWGLLPADTRIPDHSLLRHARVTSAFSSVLDNPATLLFTIGPVQSFIAAARKTRDLWMGSFLLSYLTWHAIKVVAEELGPDHVLFPSLLGQPLVDLWLSREGVCAKPSQDKLRLATLPNRFFAIVPADRAEDIAKKCEEALRDEWRRLAKEVWNQLCSKVSSFEQARQIWERQIEQFSEVYWAIYKWGKDEQEIARQFECLTTSDRFVKWLEVSKGAYKPNLGTVYAACYELTERALGARKATRNFEGHEEPADKCTICGERQALSDLTGTKSFWRNVAAKFIGDVDADGRERLCAICTVKRFAAKFVFAKDDELGIPFGFPSTDSISAATFAKAILEQWQEVKGVVNELLKKIRGNKKWSQVALVGMGIPYLERKAREVQAQDFANLDGEWLFAESYLPQRLKRAHGIELAETEIDQVRKLLGELTKSLKLSPSDYYAVLFMDGDQMGRWLSGTHDGLPKFAEILHPQARSQIPTNCQNILHTQRSVSPSLHASISEALANFALNCVPFVVEECHAGRLVYAGGDDVLALLPIKEAIPAARKLRALFSGEAELQPNGEIFVEFQSERWTGWIDWNGRSLLTMGNRATASIGIVIAHRLHPLQDVLRHGREAEEDAKEHYGRNAICIRWLKRSGEQVQMGAKFFYPDHYICDTLKLLSDFAELMGEKVSRGFATDLMQESFILAGLDKDAQESEVRRLLKRRSKNLSDEEISEWAKKLVQLAFALNEHADTSADQFDLTRPQAGIVELAKWLTFLRFLTGGGE